jgi:uncharacterized delta-60 repeat protein
MRSRRFLLPLLLSAFLVAANAYAQTCPGGAGCLDTSFGTGGTVLVPLSFIVPAPEGMVVQPDGKIVSVSGGFSNGHKLVRLNADGSLDTSFGGDGTVEFTWQLTSGSSSYYGKAYGVGLQNIGGQQRIVVAGTGHLVSGRNIIGSVLRVQRFMPDGSVDTSFGVGGSIVHNTGYALAMAIQPDGKIVTVGDAGNLVRLNVNGSLDASFGLNGVVTIDYGRALAVDSSGGVLVGGYKVFGKGNNARREMSVIRILPNGIVDTSFGSSGRAIADFGVGSQLFEVQIDPCRENCARRQLKRIFCRRAVYAWRSAGHIIQRQLPGDGARWKWPRHRHST